MSPSLMIGKLQTTTLLGPRLSAGSSRATDGSGTGEKKPAVFGRATLAMSTTWSPPGCQESITRGFSTFGLWVEEEVKLCVAASIPWDRKASVFWKILCSLTICGWAGSRTSMIRNQPQGQPNDGLVNVP